LLIILTTFLIEGAYKKADKKRIDNKRVCVEMERARVDPKWKPRRLGGGRGDSRACPSWLETELKRVRDNNPQLVRYIKPFVYKEKEKSKSKENGKERESNYLKLKNQEKARKTSSHENSDKNSENNKMDVDSEHEKKEDKTDIGEGLEKDEKRKEKKDKKDKKDKKSKKDKKNKKYIQ